jgi:HAD superfamily hydrolase (TIGR01549 family)
MRYRALLFDLFGTVVHFAPRVPTVEVAGTAWRTTMGWLRERAEQELPAVPFEALLPALMEVTEEIVRKRPPEYLEVPSRERFRRALVRVGVVAAEAPAMAERLSLIHMAHLASTTQLPEGHAAVLAELAAQYPLGLVSNFDHAATARRVLSEHGVAGCFSTIRISEEFGRRKPHPAIFHAALADLGVAASDALFIGDSLSDDVAGAQSAGLAVAWVNVTGDPPPGKMPPPDHVITHLAELCALLA